MDVPRLLLDCARRTDSERGVVSKPIDRWSLCVTAGLLLGLNVALIGPVFFFSRPSGDWLPFSSIAKAATTSGAFRGALFWRENLDLFRVSYDLVAAVAVVSMLTGTRVTRAVCALAGLASVGLVLFSWYHVAFELSFQQPAAVWDDFALLLNLRDLLDDTWGRPVMRGAWVLATVVVVAWVVLATVVFRRCADVALALPRRTRLLLATAMLLSGPAFFAFFDAHDVRTVMQLRSALIVRNVTESRSRYERLKVALGAPPDGRYEELFRARLARKPRVYLLMIEAYGQRLVSDPAMREPFREVTRRVGERLEGRGFRIRSATSQAPVFGGRSWLSIGTVQTGVRIDQPRLYNLMAGGSHRVPTLTSWFSQQGYRTIALQPGNRLRRDIRVGDIFHRDVMIESEQLAYTGPKYDFGQIPDQYSLHRLNEVLVGQTQPVFCFFMSVSTHFAWPAIPYAEDWRRLNDSVAPPDVAWGAVAGVESIPEGLHRSYFRAVEYEWRVLADFIEQEAAGDAIFVVVGDHQPLIERTAFERFDVDAADSARVQSFNTLVHVLSRDEAFVNRFEQHGFTPGLFPESGTGGLRHEGLFSLLVTELVAHMGETGASAHVRYWPDGATPGAFVR